MPRFRAAEMDSQNGNGGVDVIIKHQHSKAHNASLVVQNLSRFVIASPKKNKGSKNKFQQPKNTAHKPPPPSYEQPQTPNKPPRQNQPKHQKIEQGKRSARQRVSDASPVPIVPSSCRRRHDRDGSVVLAEGGELQRRSRRRYLGIGVAFGGRAYGAKKASTFKTLLGPAPSNTPSANTDHPGTTEKTRNGTRGSRTRPHFKRNKQINVVQCQRENPDAQYAYLPPTPLRGKVDGWAPPHKERRGNSEMTVTA